jgi:hypothetical protein
MHHLQNMILLKRLKRIHRQYKSKDIKPISKPIVFTSYRTYSSLPLLQKFRYKIRKRQNSLCLNMQ